MDKNKKCSVNGCSRNYAAMGLCHTHYWRLKHHGDINYERPRGRNICAVDGCDRIVVSGGYCGKHHRRFKKHGDPLSNGGIKIPERHSLSGSQEYIAWLNIKSRCYNNVNNMYHRYGGRGIIVCDDWLNSFISFYKDMGKKPSIYHQIDRINNDGNYEPSNCRWATRAENCQNTSRTILSEKDIREMISEYKDCSTTYSKLAKKYGVNKSAITAIFNNRNWKNITEGLL